MVASSSSLPLVHITIPSVATLPMLNTFLYTHRPDILLSALLRAPSASTASLGSRADLTAALATSLGGRELMERVNGVHGLWSNVCALGIADPA